MHNEQLKLYVNKNFVAANLPCIALLSPFWGEVIKKDNEPYAAKTYEHGFDPKYFQLVVSPKEADYVLLPHDYWQMKRRHPELLAKMLEEAEASGKPVLIDASGDVAGKIHVPNSRILRMNQYRFDLPKNEVTVPVPCEDLLESHYGEEFIPRERSELPTVGFVGWASLSLRQRLRTLIKEFPRRVLSMFNKKYKAYRKGVFWREKAVRVFNSSSRVKTNFIIRSSYSGNTRTLVGDPAKNREEFVKNLFESDYVLIVRGDANAATRFYEALSLGRIPVFIDTACVLPLEDRINYREFCVFIDHTDLKNAPDILADFHKNLSPEEFVAMQRKARYIFKNYLRYDAFSGHLARLLKQQKL